MKKFSVTFLILFVSIISTHAIDNECGRVKVKTAVGLSVNSLPAYHGQFPWIATLHKGDQYYCGASIISQWHLLSAAHCVFGDTNDYHALLGRFNISDASESDWIRRNISEIHVNENYNGTREVRRSESDIAIYKMSQKIQYTNFIQPICLPEPSTNVFDAIGVVSGYGLTEIFANHPDSPSYITMKSIENWECLDKGLVYGKIISKNSFCAGSVDGTSALCQGDGGSGFYVYDRATSQFTIYGIISYAVGLCNPKDFVACVDITKFIPWIQEKIGQ